MRWAGAWRAHESIAYNFSSTLAHQTETLTQMLDDNIRWLGLLVDYCQPGATSGPMCLCDADDACPAGSTPLPARLTEIETWMAANPSAVVTLHFEGKVEVADLQQAFTDAGLDPYLYRSTVGPWYRESWPMTINNMAQKNRRLVVFAPGMLSTDNLFLTTRVAGDMNQDPSATDNNLGSLYSGNSDSYPCANDAGELPQDVIGFNQLYVLEHVMAVPSWSLSACYNVDWDLHVDACANSATDANVMFFDFYNNSSAPWDFADLSPVPYENRCIRSLTGCLTDADCDVGSCGGFYICVNCVNDSDCLANQHCDTLFGACMSDLPDGAVCVSDAACQSGNCDTLCHSCTSDRDCDATQWCDVYGGCQDKKANGYGCITGTECLSDACHMLFCADCDDQADCGAGQYCDLNPLPGESACVDEKPNGGSCAQPLECSSGDCYAFLCSECDAQEDCTGDTYCTLDSLNYSTCEAKKETGGACLSGVECLSGGCDLIAGCLQCTNDSHCGSGEFCDLGGACQTELANGGVCTPDLDSACTSGSCYLGFCADCDEQGDCGSGDYCNLDTLPGQSTCVAQKTQGSSCFNGFECVSGSCTGGTCDNCTSDADCDASHFCNAANVCTADLGNNDFCDRDAQCSTGYCVGVPPLALCAQCRNGADCQAGEYCDAGGDCQAKVQNGNWCGTDNNVCVSGNCWATVCSECNEHSDCPSGDYCTLDVVPPIDSSCQPKKSNGSSCGSAVECVSNACTGWVCGECASDADCPSSQNCDAFNNCAPDVGNNEPCLRDSQCTTGHCAAPLCAECLNDSHCPSTEFCNGFGDCEARVGNGSVCAVDNVCLSNNCWLGLCADCNEQSDCPSGYFCTLEPVPFNANSRCLSKKSNGSACGSAVECQSNCCSFFTCGGLGC